MSFNSYTYFILDIKKQPCWIGHEMVLKDEKECYYCHKCHNEKEGKRSWFVSGKTCWDADDHTNNYCLECVSHIGNQDHIIFNKTVNDHLKFFEGLNSLITLSILIFQLAQTVTC